LPIHDSWGPQRLPDWVRTQPEPWIPYSAAPELVAKLPSGSNARVNIAVLCDQFTSMLSSRPVRQSPVRWKLDHTSDDGRTGGTGKWNLCGTASVSGPTN
jgi:hypothetical protein